MMENLNLNIVKEICAMGPNKEYKLLLKENGMYNEEKRKQIKKMMKTGKKEKQTLYWAILNNGSIVYVELLLEGYERVVIDNDVEGATTIDLLEFFKNVHLRDVLEEYIASY